DYNAVAQTLDLLQHLRKRHCLVDTRNAKSNILHHPAEGTSTRIRPLQQLLHTPVRINLHGAQVVKALHLPRLLAKLLVERIGQVVRRVGTDQEDSLAGFGELDGEGTCGRGLADTAFAADKDPAEGLLVEDGLERWLHGGKLVEVRHGLWWGGGVC